eukprot:203266_1
MAIPHSEEQFKLFSTTHMSVDRTKRLITKTSHGAVGGSTVYGMVTFGHHLSDMSYDENAKGFLRYNKHKWVFKVHKRGMGHMAIGIDNSDGKYTNVCPFTQKNTLNYSYWSSGKKCESDNKSAFNIGWDEGDVIVMYYDSVTRWLVFLVNEQNLKKAFNINTPSKTQYRMCVYMQNKHDCVSLLSYSCGDEISIMSEPNSPEQVDEHKSQSHAKAEEPTEKEESKPDVDAEDAGVVAKLKAKIQEQHHTIGRLETENTEMNTQNEALRTRNRTHRRRESEVFAPIGDDAKNVVQTFEELEESRKKIENDQLELAFLQAEKQRMAIAYDHQKENATKYRQESAVLKNKIKEMETSTRKRTQSRADELQTAKTRLDSLEKKAKVSENMELELAFYKAEKQRMEVKIEFQDRNQKQTKELNKELQKAVKSEKEKVRRLSQSFNVSDIEELNKLPQVQQAKEDDWKNEVDKLKEELAAEQMEKTVLQREKNDLMAKLTNVESTQAHEDEDSEEDDDGNASPLSGDENASRPEVQMAAEPPKRSEDIETLKFKLANAELQNAQLKRRVSIAGIEKEQLSQLWEQPRVTIQMVSEFIERLPLKHKEKIWARHATGQYIAKNKILHTLHSFVALCIKIKDRTAVAPSRHDIEKRLVPFADVIRQRTENANGMALDEFNNELHYWILEPVSGLIMTDGEQKQWLDEIDLLRDELMKAQEAKRRIERKSQMDLTVLLDKMKELDQDPSDQIDELEEQVEELHTIVNELQDEIKQLTVENIALRQGRDKARESEDDEEEEEEEVVPQLIDASQQKTLSEYRELQKEQEFDEDR